MQHVPKGFRIDWCDLLAEELDNFCEDRSAEALSLLLLLPKVILLAADRGGRRAKRQVLNVCRERIRAWKEQNWHTLWNNALKKKVKSRKTRAKVLKKQKFRERVLRLMADKRFESGEGSSQRRYP